MKTIIIILAILTLVGCALGPDYRRPDITSPSGWRVQPDEAQDVANTAWWEQFQDSVLTDLIQTALRENYDLKIASARVEQYVGQYWIARSGFFPQISAAGSGGRQKITEGGPNPMAESIRNPSAIYQGAFNGSWEIDVWGRLRRTTEAARADLLSTEEGRRAVILTLVTTVANSYINLRDLDRQLEIAIDTARSREASYKLFSLRFEAGIVSELELSQVKSEYEQAMARVPLIRKQIAQQENGLSVLLGRNPGQIARGKTIDELVLPVIPEGLPSDLLERRPDIRQAEQELIAANARIGAAKALYFPTISLTGSLGWASINLTNLFAGSSQAWNWAGAFTAPIFTGGAITGNYWASEAVQRQLLFRYQRAIQNAFREVDDALSDQKQTREQLGAQNRQVSALSDYARIARLRYDNGYTSYLEVLDAERSLFSAQLDYVQSQGLLFQALVNLYTAMGGGWVAKADGMTGNEESSDGGDK